MLTTEFGVESVCCSLNATTIGSSTTVFITETVTLTDAVTETEKETHGDYNRKGNGCGDANRKSNAYGIVTETETHMVTVTEK